MSKVSILLSVYNGERFVRDAVLSLLAQTYRDFELLIVDDASTDGAHEILEELAAQDSRIRVLTNSTNLELTKSLNMALRLPLDKLGVAQDDYVARMDADDIALPDRLEKQIAFLEGHPDIDVVGTAYEWIDEDGQVIGRPHVITNPEDIRRALPRTNPLLHSSVVMRRTALQHASGYDESYRRAQDYDLWLRLSRTSHMTNLPEILMQKRLAKGMISFANERAQLRCAVRARIHALRRGDYPWWNAVYLLKPLVASLLPLPVVRWARVHVFGQRIYRDLCKSTNAPKGAVNSKGL
ncbi:MAG: glycosyltransferase [Candidatus Uhrbacteria bacterium]|nr:glycosyltransferase [Candidatus Uhrbacteria bacterium]